MAEFKIGDTVKLKSGSPSMTIEKFFTDLNGKIYNDRVICIWFVNYEPKRDTFYLNTLMLDK
jgi:uncharacterized protein YodC (DUF2158 family)